MSVTRIPMPDWTKVREHDERLDMSLADDRPHRPCGQLSNEGRI